MVQQQGSGCEVQGQGQDEPPPQTPTRTPTSGMTHRLTETLWRRWKPTMTAGPWRWPATLSPSTWAPRPPRESPSGTTRPHGHLAPEFMRRGSPCPFGFRRHGPLSGSAQYAKDVLTGVPPRHLGFMGAKPAAWTRWVLEHARLRPRRRHSRRPIPRLGRCISRGRPGRPAVKVRKPSKLVRDSPCTGVDTLYRG